MMSTLASQPSEGRHVRHQESAYVTRMANCSGDVRAAQALRFEVFNLELDEGLVTSYENGLDADPFDAVCDHLLVCDASNGDVVGTYRMQTGIRAARSLGYYSAREFDFLPLENMRAHLLELGRACIHSNHRNFAVINALWKGIATYARKNGTRFLIGCSSLTSQDESVGAAAYARLAKYLAPTAWRTTPLPSFACAMDTASADVPHIPRLLSAYLALGAAICGPPAIDREFRTIDFLTLLDLDSPAMLALQQRGRFAAAE